ncbi:hypothetical protein roselon_00501 [Roseibacterium elongatum DSM 19469]|uniref:Phosphoglycerate mutase family protein n=1 Tax=Roseicyclus elongatus DSM 19469 TaxID=1294273 RepID=W8RYN0_9RHOB|nr:histidine phosphatase family protein [Roseibacterium elongatum]AHM02942.1 hypothetical protein roselon_00501 [Roseibacterium elongatum DSM 19469]
MAGVTRRAALAPGLAAAAGMAACTPIGGAGTGIASDLPEGSRIVLVRHMDRDNGTLNAMGLQRAQDLVAAIADIPLDDIYTHDLRRNVDSARPLAQARAIEMTLIDLDRAPGSLPGLAAGRSIIWVGNRGNLAEIWNVLSLPGAPPRLGYGDIAVVEAAPARRLTVERRRFGPRPSTD